MDGLVWDERPDLRRPALVAAFKGWNDAGEAASEAASWLARTTGAPRFAWIDPEEHVDFQSTRPQVEIVDGVTRELRWPTTECFAVRLPEAARDLVVVAGIEPNYRWRSFCRALLTVAAETRCSLVVTLGALLADVPHTRPVTITGTASDPELVGDAGLVASRYEGPTGIVGVLQDAARGRDLSSVSLWAPVPHYLAGPPHPGATLALLERLASVVGVSFDLDDLRELGQQWRARVDEAISDDDNAKNYVRELEERATDEHDVPSADDLAAEVERFLRDREE